ncbi:MAG: hypothetical protein ACR2PL_00690 [Dehalococcoidia bacterium]
MAKRQQIVKDAQRAILDASGKHLLANGRLYKALQPSVRGFLVPPWSDSDRQDLTRTWLDK